MSRSLRLVLSTIALAALVIGTVSATTAGGPKVLDARMAGIPTGGLVLHGITGGGVPWVIDAGRAKLFADGRLEVEVDGLVLATTGTNPIPTGRAIVTCSSAAVASTDAVPFSPTGDALVTARVDLPDTCLAPAVFFAGVTGAGDRWFAVTGLGD
ncbi:MAG TPA: hypothetical protein VFV72_15730 [Candidatus Limnocylindrales bacterium]|nr:hypothetical protein [Candidatus Limnocylindrales bacterium]